MSHSRTPVACLVLFLILSIIPRFTFASDDSPNQAFRDNVVQLVRESAEAYTLGQEKPNAPEALSHLDTWVETIHELSLRLYHRGKIIGTGEARGKMELASLIGEAVQKMLQSNPSAKTDLDSARFFITLSSSDETHSFVEYDGRGLEVMNGFVVRRTLDKTDLQDAIEAGKRYLGTVVDETRHGIHKYYYADKDTFEPRLHAIYTASWIYTMLNLVERNPDDQIWNDIEESAEFLLSMQNIDPESDQYGAFYYSYDLQKQKPEQRFVVGTTSKTIFTLLRLYEKTVDERYREAAERAAKWLLRMQKEDGTMNPSVRYKQGEWHTSNYFSYLYNGQVLSALSRMHRAFPNPDYYGAAEKIAQNFLSTINEEGCYLGDDFRKPNPISSSWVVLSLYDFYKVSHETAYKEAIFRCSEELLTRQNVQEENIFHHGRWQGSYSTSGTGWLIEVLGEIYFFCEEEGRTHCADYKEAIVNGSRWILQHTYSPENSFALPDSDQAEGGTAWNHKALYVRTDAVCHAMNAFMRIEEALEDEKWIEFTEEEYGWL